jgi:protein-S-isoprenylcysteine O-methyltransferase Ste14
VSTVNLKFLELKVPPPIAAVLVGLLMWRISLVAPSSNAPELARLLFSPVVAIVGAAFVASGAIAFRRAKTTTNPTKPGAASSLVSSGPYRLTRNPMYVGLVLVLVAWAIFLWSAWSLAGPLVFAAYIRRFQIAPEERVLSALFGKEYHEYQGAVRRWL